MLGLAALQLRSHGGELGPRLGHGQLVLVEDVLPIDHGARAAVLGRPVDLPVHRAPFQGDVGVVLKVGVDGHPLVDGLERSVGHELGSIRVLCHDHVGQTASGGRRRQKLGIRDTVVRPVDLDVRVCLREQIVGEVLVAGPGPLGQLHRLAGVGRVSARTRRGKQRNCRQHQHDTQDPTTSHL